MSALPGARIRIRDIIAGSDPALRPAHRLLMASLPAGEVVGIRDWRHSLAEGSAGVWTDQRWHLLVATRNGQVRGMASGSYLGSHNIGVIGYLALHPSLRGRGVGPRLRARLRHRFERDARDTRGESLAGMLGEVDPANPWLRRLVHGAGALALDLPYYQPSLHPLDAPSPLVLYYQPIAVERRWLPAAEVRQLLFAIWRRLYRIPRPMHHPEFRLMLKALRGRRRIGPLAGL
ncbi:MAG: GNAT family N-acetyltransferase [Gemmatimonadota bacterium]